VNVILYLWFGFDNFILSYFVMYLTFVFYLPEDGSMVVLVHCAYKLMSVYVCAFVASVIVIVDHMKLTDQSSSSNAGSLIAWCIIRHGQLHIMVVSTAETSVYTICQST